ncbi:MAG: carbohydrate ABC transporter permease [Defluviitaleaceae bacterium]|nr:carbohydrate ABC transporter permease [Defluviitaleaceae bacterium]
MNKILRGFFYAFFCLLVFAPVLQILFAAFTETGVLAEILSKPSMFFSGYYEAFAFPSPVSVKSFSAAVTPAIVRQWTNSFVYAAAITFLQCAVSFPAGFLFAKINFAGKKAMFFFITVAMLLPFHVIMLPGFIMLNAAGLIDNPVSVLLPGIFSPFGVFFFRQFISQVDNEQIEAAQIDGASWTRILLQIVLPNIAGAFFVFVLISFLQYYAAVEPALIFLRSAAKIPLGVTLRALADYSPAMMFAPSVIYLLPPVAVFAICSFGMAGIKIVKRINK